MVAGKAAALFSPITRVLVGSAALVGVAADVAVGMADIIEEFGRKFLRCDKHKVLGDFFFTSFSTLSALRFLAQGVADRVCIPLSGLDLALITAVTVLTAACTGVESILTSSSSSLSFTEAFFSCSEER